MTRYTKAYSAFTKGLAEVETLCHIASLREKRDPIGLKEEINALSRSSIVLLSSRLEAYVKELGGIALDSLYEKSVPREKMPSQFYYHISKDKLDEIQDTSDPEKIARKVFLFIERDLPYWSRAEAFPKEIPIDRFNMGFSNPTLKRIGKYFNRFGYSGEDYQHDLYKRLANACLPTTNMVNQLVYTRNKIAHGDPMATQTPLELAKMIETIRLFCRCTDEVFASWWKTHFCSIRS